MAKKDVWQLYYHLLPFNKIYIKYIKNTTDIPTEDIDNDLNTIKLEKDKLNAINTKVDTKVDNKI